ncbi:MAG: hypothetical protein ACLS3M_03735 [Collinsella sp.]
MASAAPHNAYAELFEQLDALTSRGFGAWCAQALGDEVVYALDVDWYRRGRAGKRGARTGRHGSRRRARPRRTRELFGRLLYGASPLGLARAGTLRQQANDAEFRPPR